MENHRIRYQPTHFLMKVPLRLMLLIPLVLGCAADKGAQSAGHSGRPRRVAASQASFESSRAAKQMDLQNEIGVYDGADIEQTLAEHLDEVRGCYGRAGRAQKYAGGKVTLRFIVNGEGKPSDVLVIATDLGNYDVERCLVDVGRRVQFPAPDGKKATTFEYPVEFKSTREVDVQDLDGSLKIDHDVSMLARSLGVCGSVADGQVSASFYIEPNGTIGSVGLAAQTPLNEQAGTCVVRTMRRWKMSTSLPGRMLRCKVKMPPVIATATAEPTPSRPAVSSVSARRRRR